MICKIFFSNFFVLYFHFLDNVFKNTNVVILMKSNLFGLFFSFVTCTLGVKSKKLLPNPRSQRFTPVFSSKNFTHLTLLFRSLFYLEFTFCMFWGSAEAEIPILGPPDVKNWLIWKDPDAGEDWRQEERGKTEDEMVGWHHWLDGHEFK